MRSPTRIVREAIYEAVVNRSIAPSPEDVARVSGIPLREAEDSFRTLADDHVIILRPGTLDLWAAPPFALFDSGFQVETGERAWRGVCAWDAFGIPAALHAHDAGIEARCGWSGDPISCGVRADRAFGDAVVHLLVPASRFWDDIIYT